MALVLLFSSAVLCLIFYLPACAVQPAQSKTKLTPKTFNQCEFSSGGSLVKVDGQRLFVEAYSCKGSKIVKNYDPNIPNKPLGKPEPVHLRSIYLLQDQGRAKQINQVLYAPNHSSTLTLKTPNGQVCVHITGTPVGINPELPIPDDFMPMTAGKRWQDSVDYLMDANCSSLAIALGKVLTVMHRAGNYSFKIFDVRFDVEKADIESPTIFEAKKISASVSQSVQFYDHCKPGYKNWLKAFGQTVETPAIECSASINKSQKRNLGLKNTLIDTPVLQFMQSPERFILNRHDELQSSLTLKNNAGTICAKVEATTTREPKSIPNQANNTDWQQTIHFLTDKQCELIGIESGGRLALVKLAGKSQFFLHRIQFKVQAFN